MLPYIAYMDPMGILFDLNNWPQMKRMKYEKHLSFRIYFVIVFFWSWARVGVVYPNKSTHVLIPRNTCGLVLDHFILGSLIEGIRRYQKHFGGWDMLGLYHILMSKSH